MGFDDSNNGNGISSEEAMMGRELLQYTNGAYGPGYVEDTEVVQPEQQSSLGDRIFKADSAADEERRKMIESNSEDSPVVFHKPGDDSWKNPVSFKSSKKSAEYKKFLLLLKFIDESDNLWIVVEGREDAYFKIKEYISILDIGESYILAEGLKWNGVGEGEAQEKSIALFMENIIKNDLIKDDSRYLVEEILYEYNESLGIGGEY